MVRNKVSSDAVSCCRRMSLKFEMYSKVSNEAKIFVRMSMSKGKSKIVSV
jgi:hypothetical protein